MNLKRSLLAIITAISLLSVVFALSQSLGEPQVQAQLELYQTNLILNAAEFKTDDFAIEENTSKNNLNNLTKNLIGSEPYTVAQQQYQKTLNLTENSLINLETQVQKLLNNNPETTRQSLKQSIQKDEALVDELRIKSGVIYAYQNQLDLAKKSWEKVENENLKNTLTSIWIDNDINNGSLPETINSQFDGWFKNVNLAKIYEIKNNKIELEKIAIQKQELAEKAIYRLLSLSLIPVVGGIVGFGLIIFLLVQWFLKKEESILATNANESWESPWDGETIWQVLVVGFFFISQVVLPILFGFSGFNPAGLGIKGKALYVLVSYLLMVGGGLTVLYLSLKSFFPLPENWFKLRNPNWYWWGIGGYLTAIPLVFLVSLLNQQIWQGKGGSNPLLLLTLQSQDKFAIFVLFITASVAAPIFEEIMFRGFLLPSLTRYLPVSGAIVVSGFTFAIAHLSLAETIPLATLGIILGVVYTRSRSLMSSIIIHSLWNSGTLFTLFVLGSSLD